MNQVQKLRERQQQRQREQREKALLNTLKEIKKELFWIHHDIELLTLTVVNHINEGGDCL